MESVDLVGEACFRRLRNVLLHATDYTVVKMDYYEGLFCSSSAQGVN